MKMKRYIKKIMKYLAKVFVVLLVISGIVLLVSQYFEFILSETFTYAGIICMILGATSLIGKTNVTSDPTYFQAKSISTRSLSQSTLEEFKSKIINYRFLAFMFVVGGILISIGIILTNYRL